MSINLPTSKRKKNCISILFFAFLCEKSSILAFILLLLFLQKREKQHFSFCSFSFISKRRVHRTFFLPPVCFFFLKNRTNWVLFPNEQLKTDPFLIKKKYQCTSSWHLNVYEENWILLVFRWKVSLSITFSIEYFFNGIYDKYIHIVQ
jgi:hypothetical protein